MNWNWNAIGAVGQILGSLATFVTVGFLAVQMHDSEMDARRVIAQSRAERNMQLNLTSATNERLAAIHIKGNRALRRDGPIPVSPYFAAAIELGLTPEEAIMLGAELSARWNNISQTILYIDELLPGDRAQFDGTTRGVMREPLASFWYEFNKPTANPDVVRYVDNLLAQPG